MEEQNWLIELLTNNNFGIILSYILVFLTNIFTYLFTRKKYKENLKHQKIDNLNDTFKLYTTIIEDLELRVMNLQKKVIEMEKDFEIIKKENDKLRTENTILKNNTCKHNDK